MNERSTPTVTLEVDLRDVHRLVYTTGSNKVAIPNQYENVVVYVVETVADRTVVHTFLPETRWVTIEGVHDMDGTIP